MDYEQLKLGNQFCFPVYAASRLITREYQPYLDELGITYPQYLVLLVLWESDGMTVNDIAHKLILNTNTVTPLLKRMESAGLLKRSRSDQDERKVEVYLTPGGIRMREAAASIPEKLVRGIHPGSLNLEEMVEVRDRLNRLIAHLSAREDTGKE
jgi:DNA-binding MarR family transcriptional regulator